MPHFICKTCGVQFALSPEPPEQCITCEDERQYVGWDGQEWTTLEQLRTDHQNQIHCEEPHLSSLHTEPKFAIGQRAFLLQLMSGNVLWDCISLLDDATVAAVRALGGISKIAISHPHYYATAVEWSHAFGGVSIYIHAADRQWVMRPDPAIVFWEGATLSLGEVTLIRCGGHFEGGTVLHWLGGAEGQGVLLSGDIIQVVADRRHVSFMYSYPNYIPLPPAAIQRIVEAVEPFAFDRIYGAFPGLVIARNAKSAVAFSAGRYLLAIGAEKPTDAAPPPAAAPSLRIVAEFASSEQSTDVERVRMPLKKAGIVRAIGNELMVILACTAVGAVSVALGGVASERSTWWLLKPPIYSIPITLLVGLFGLGIGLIVGACCRAIILLGIAGAILGVAGTWVCIRDDKALPLIDAMLGYGILAGVLGGIAWLTGGIAGARRTAHTPAKEKSKST